MRVGAIGETERGTVVLGREVDHQVTTGGDRGRGIGTGPGKDEMRIAETGVVIQNRIVTVIDGTDVVLHRPDGIPVHEVMTNDIEIPK